MAEFWADGPASETPPGHRNTPAKAVTDAPSYDPNGLRLVPDLVEVITCRSSAPASGTRT